MGPGEFIEPCNGLASEEATETGDKRRPDGPLGSYAAFTLTTGPARFILGTQIKGKNLSFCISYFHIPAGLYPTE